MVLKRPPTSALSIFAIAVLISVVGVTVSATNSTTTTEKLQASVTTVTPQTSVATTSKPQIYATTTAKPQIYATTTAKPPIDATTTAKPQIDATTAAKPQIDATTTAKPPIDATTTAKPQIDATTTAKPQIDATTTAKPQIDATTTAKPQIDATTTAKPQIDATTTAKPQIDATTTAKPQIDATTTAKPQIDATTTAKPQIDATTTAKPQIDATTTAKPQIDATTTAKPQIDATTTAKPQIDATTTAKPQIDATTTAKPQIDATTTAKPQIDATTTAKPQIDATTTAKPQIDATTTAKPQIDATTTAKPPIDATTTAKPQIDATTTAKPQIDATTTAKPQIFATTTAKPQIYATTTAKPQIYATITVKLQTNTTTNVKSQTSTVMVVRPSTYTTMMSYTTSVLTTPKITPSPSPTSKVPTVSSSAAVGIPNTKYYEYSAKFTLTNITKSGIKNQSDIEILDRLITNCIDEYTEENSTEYQKFEKYLQKEICGIFESSSQSCFLQITSMKCGSIITEFDVTLEVNSTQSNNITNGTAFNKVEEIIKNGTLGAFVTNTSSFTSNFNGEVNKPKDVSPTSTMMTTRPMRRPTITPTPTSTRKQPVVSTSSMTMPKITPSPSPTSKVPTVSSSAAVGIPNTKYYEYSANFTLTNITKSGIKNQSDFEILDRLITNCKDEYTKENSTEYQKFEKYMQKEICGIFESSSQSCFLQITSMKCGSIITEFDVTLEVNSTQSNNITNGTAFDKVEEIIKNGTLGAFVTNTSSFASIFNGEVNKPKDVSPTSTMMTTRPMRRPTIIPTPTTTRKQPVVSTSSMTMPKITLSPSPTSKVPTVTSSAAVGKQPVVSTSSIIPKTSNKTFQYEISFIITNIDESHVSDEENFIILHLLITKCNDEYIEKNSIQFITFQMYLQKEIYASIYKSSSEECSVTVEELNCGSLKIQAVVELKDNSTKLIEDKVKEGSLGGLIVSKTSFSSKYIGEITPKPTRKPPQAEPEVYVIVTIKYSWKEFCVVETHFKETIAERSYDIKGKPLTPNNIYIINRERCRDKNFDSTEEEIEVRFTVITEEQNEATIQVGKDLIDLVDSRQTRKLGNLLEDKIVKVELGGVKAPKSSGKSDTEKIWLAVGISLGAIVLLILLYFCCCRQSEKESDTERGTTNLFLMDEMDSSKKETTELVNEGFDDQDGTDTPLTHRISTFKDNPENGNKPITKSSSDDVSASAPADNDSMDAPLGEGEDTDDELGMTVADVAIEPESEEEKKGATPPGTLPIIPPDPTHMAIKYLPTFLEESGKENEKNKEYEDLDQSITLLSTYPSNTLDRNRSAALVPKPETRVKLGGENDYINANFVKDHNGKNNFIATQHPLSNTMRDFWTMVWDQDVSVVVMVNEKEKDLENYHNYWLDHKNSLTIYGHMQVKTEKMEALPGYSLTKFVLQNSQESKVTKAVSHYRFTNWTENGIPNVKEFAGFIKSVEKARLENLQQPIVVHCSEGQGYTGVAIATDIGLRVYNESDKKSIINVFDCVEKMRKDRNGIVCSKDMYNFIFKVLSALTDTKESNDSKL